MEDVVRAAGLPQLDTAAFLVTVDVLSNGRMELGLGAGWHKREYDAVGLSFDPPGVRVRRFEESVEIIRPMLPAKRSFSKAHYKLSDYSGTPVPVQQSIPLLIGWGGQRDDYSSWTRRR
jgi:alkanesulfonate monooxygenase SsuD/methylene tetrahydromethanopterin reductase-like flavin-dependent oxidoreductase (luciferase family)